MKYPDDLMRQRNEARQQKDYILADKIREEIKSRGFEVIDKPEGSIMQPLGRASTEQKDRKLNRMWNGMLLTMRKRGSK